jgi:hypothetical protein
MGYNYQEVHGYCAKMSRSIEEELRSIDLQDSQRIDIDMIEALSISKHRS